MKILVLGWLSLSLSKQGKEGQGIAAYERFFRLPRNWFEGSHWGRKSVEAQSKQGKSKLVLSGSECTESRDFLRLRLQSLSLADISDIYIYIYACNPTGRTIFRPEHVREQSERRKTKAEKSKEKKEQETLQHGKPPPFWWGCFMAICDCKTGDFLRF